MLRRGFEGASCAEDCVRGEGVESNRAFPSFEDVVRHVEGFVERHGRIARLEELGVSEEGRPVLAVVVTDGQVDATQKGVAMIVCGRHGNELGTRAVGTGLLDWLASEEAEEIVRRQVVIIVPVANPDGCVRGEFHAPTDRLSPTEERTIMAAAERYIPDAVVDIHSLGGNDIEAVITSHILRQAEDDFIHHMLAAEMLEAAERRGYPFDLHMAAFTANYNNFFAGACYERFHSNAFGMEVNHLALSPDDAAGSGVAAVAGLLRAGNRRLGWQAAPGYPNEIVVGSFCTSIRPAGRDALAMRQSRAVLWRNRDGFVALRRAMPARDRLEVTVDYKGAPEAVRWAVCCRLRGFPEVRAARMNGRSVAWESWRDSCSTFVSVQVDSLLPQRYQCTLEL